MVVVFAHTAGMHRRRGRHGRRQRRAGPEAARGGLRRPGGAPAGRAGPQPTSRSGSPSCYAEERARFLARARRARGCRPGAGRALREAVRRVDDLRLATAEAVPLSASLEPGAERRSWGRGCIPRSPDGWPASSRGGRRRRGRLDDAAGRPGRGRRRPRRARLRLSADHTVVALAGATGSGKSSTFNALTGLDLAAVGVRRPTTSWTTACIWGTTRPPRLLDWLGVPPRHRVSATPAGTGHEARGPRRPGAARPARPRLDRGGPPPRGRPAGASWPTCWSGCSTRRSTPTRRSTSATCARWRRTRR